MARLIENIDIHKIDIDNCTFCRLYNWYCLLPMEVGIPFFKSAIEVEFRGEIPNMEHPISCLQIDEEEKKILQFIFNIDYIESNIIALREQMYLLERMYTILEKKDEYVDVMYCFAGVEETSNDKSSKKINVVFDQSVSSKLNMYSAEDIVELYNTIMYELRIKRRRIIGPRIPSICINNIYMEYVMFTDLTSFYIRVPMKIREFAHMKSARGFVPPAGPETVGKFILCTDEKMWNVPFTDIDVEVLKNSKNFLKG